VQIVVQGTYYNIESFFDAVEKMPRAVSVPGFQLAVADGAGTVSSSSDSAAGTKALAPGTLKGQINAVVFESPQVAGAAPLAPVTSK
jgi:hypothetical protein